MNFLILRQVTTDKLPLIWNKKVSMVLHSYTPDHDSSDVWPVFR